MVGEWNLIIKNKWSNNNFILKKEYLYLLQLIIPVVQFIPIMAQLISPKMQKVTFVCLCECNAIMYAVSCCWLSARLQ